MGTFHATATSNSIVAGAISRRGAMQRPGAVGAMAALTGTATSARAQDGTPAAGDAIVPVEPFPGGTAEIFGRTESSRAPGQTMYAVRFTFQPGAGAFPHGHPGTVLLGISSGTLGWTAVSGTAQVVRGAAGSAPGAPEPTEPGVEVLLEVGDSIFYDEAIVHTARGASNTPTIVEAALLLTTGEPLLMVAEDMEGMDMGTPAP